MPKHRSNVYVVLRESFNQDSQKGMDVYCCAVIGVYATMMRAEEVVGVSRQALVDAGMKEDEYKFSVRIPTWYDE